MYQRSGALLLIHHISLSAIVIQWPVANMGFMYEYKWDSGKTKGRNPKIQNAMQLKSKKFHLYFYILELIQQEKTISLLKTCCENL